MDMAESEHSIHVGPNILQCSNSKLAWPSFVVADPSAQALMAAAQSGSSEVGVSLLGVSRGSGNTYIYIYILFP